MLQSTPRLPHLVPCTGLAHGNLSIMGYLLAWSPSILSPFLPLSPTLSWRTSPPRLYLGISAVLATRGARDPGEANHSSARLGLAQEADT